MKAKLLTLGALALLSTLNPQLSAAPMGTAFSYQGRLNDGANPAQGIYDLRFALYDALAGDTQVGSSLTNAATSVTNGLFTVTLDFGAAFTGNARWLEIGVRTNGSGAFATLAPRQPLTPSPYALYAPSAGAAATAATAGSANSVAAANVTGTLALGQMPATVLTNNAAGVTLAGIFSGNGAALTNVNADQLDGLHGAFYQNAANLTAGTLADARLSVNVPLLNANQTFTGTNLFSQRVGIGSTNPAQLLQLGDANVSGSQGMIRFASRSPTNPNCRTWDIGVPQTGGDTSGIGYSFVIDDTLLGTDPEFIIRYGTGRVGIGRTNPATTLDVNGTVTATNFAGNASGLTNLNASQLAAGTVPLGQLPGAVVTNNETGLSLGGTFSGNGGGLTNLNTANLTGTVADARLSPNVALLNANQVFSGSNRFAGIVVLTNAANALAGAFAGNGAGLTNLNASQLAAGTVPLALLPGPVVTNNGTGLSLSGTFAGNGAGMTNVNLLTVNSQGAIGWTTNWGNFLLASSPAVAGLPTSVTAADVNGDGKVDLITACNEASVVMVLTNNGSGSFVLASTLAVGTGPQSVTAADVNGDGKVDLISANYNVGTLTVLTNNGSGFVLASSPGVGSNPYCVTAADVNGDGKVDLISADSGAKTLSVLTNNGSGGFVLASSPGMGNNPYWVTAADVNGDGKVDLISAIPGNDWVSVLTNNGNGGFVLAARLDVGSAPVAVTAADVNGDGKLDLISANEGANTLSVLTNNGSGGFVLAATLAVGTAPASVTAADINGDGKLDLISGNLNSGTLSVLTNNGRGGFVLASSPVVGSGPTSVAAADVNGDGKLDLISANATANTLSVLFNVVSGYSGSFQGSFTGDGSGLNNLDAADLTGTVADARLSANVALLNANQAFTGANRFAGVVTLTNAGNLLSGTGTFAGNGGGLTNLAATGLTGTVADARLSANVALLNTNQAFTGSNRFAGVATLTNAGNMLAGTFTGTSAGTFTGNGGSLTNLSAANLTGTVADGRLTTNVALLNVNQTFTGTNLFGQRVGIGSTNPGQLLQVGDATIAGSQGMIRLGSRSPTNSAYRTWDIGVPQTGGDTTGIGYSFVIDDPLLGTTPEFVIRWNTGYVGIGRTNPATALDVNGTVTATGFSGNGAGLTNVPGTFVWQVVAGATVAAQPNAGYVANNATQVSITLPASPNIGDIVRVSGMGAGGWKIAQNAGQSVFVASAAALSPGVTWTARDSSRNWVSVASSADGSKLVAAAQSAPGVGQIYTSTDSGVTWTTRGVSTNWLCVASSADGSKLVAAVSGGQIYTSTDSGTNWTARESGRSWRSVASSADGSKLAAVVYGGQIYSSTNSGVSWTPRASGANWVSVASSADGTKLVAGVTAGQLYTSPDSGLTWTARENMGNWYSVASSADGSKLAAANYGYQMYTSTDSGVTWTPRGISTSWYAVASSADGSKLVGVVSYGQIYTSTPSSVLPSSTTTVGTAGYLTGGQLTALELQYIGNGQFMPLSYVGTIFAY